MSLQTLTGKRFVIFFVLVFYVWNYFKKLRVSYSVRFVKQNIFLALQYEFVIPSCRQFHYVRCFLPGRASVCIKLFPLLDSAGFNWFTGAAIVGCFLKFLCQFSVALVLVGLPWQCYKHFVYTNISSIFYMFLLQSVYNIVVCGCTQMLNVIICNYIGRRAMLT